MKIAVTGATGFIGQALVRRLKEERHEVLELTRINGFNLLGNTESIPSFEVLIHLAADSFVPDAYQRPADFYRTNVMGTVNMLELCRRQKARCIFMSSYVYGRPQYLPIDEAHPLSALNPYGETKLLGEQVCKAYTRDFGLETVILRLFNVYGAGQAPQFLIPKILEQAKAGSISLQDPRPRRDFVYLTDVIELVVKTIDLPLPLKTETFNIGSGRSTSIDELIDIIKTHYPALQVHFSGEQRPNEVLDTVSNIEKAQHLLNWKPRYTLEQGIKEIIDQSA